MSIGFDAYRGSLPKMNFNLGQGQLASLQTSTRTEVPEIDSIKLPDWMSPSADANINELLKAYGGVRKAFDPTAQVNARNDAIAYNTAAGTQAANNAATEYANRAAQSGADASGAGVVKAQALMPVLSANAAMKTEAADVAAKAHQQGTAMLAQIATTIGQLRTSHLQSMIQFATGQQQTKLQNQQFQASLAQDRYKTDIQSQLEQQKLAAAADEQKRLAAMGILSAPGPSGTYTTDAFGNVVSGNDFYTKLKNWGDAKTSAQATLAGML